MKNKIQTTCFGLIMARHDETNAYGDFGFG